MHWIRVAMNSFDLLLGVVYIGPASGIEAALSLRFKRIECLLLDEFGRKACCRFFAVTS